MEDYSGYDVVSRKDRWDPTTRRIVEDRMGRPPEHRFFSTGEIRTLNAAISRLLPQQRDEPIPILPFIDDKLSRNATDGTRYEGMPQMQELWRLFAVTLDEEAQIRHDRPFAEADIETQDAILEAVAKGETRSLAWKKLPVRLAFEHIILTAAAFYYAHPFAWNEVGWGGPKYPEIYVRVRCGRKDPVEAGEVGHVRE